MYDEVAATLDVKDKQEIKNEILELLKNYNISDTIETINVVENGVNKLIYSLDEKLKEINSLAILLMWENLVNISAKN